MEHDPTIPQYDIGTHVIIEDPNELGIRSDWKGVEGVITGHRTGRRLCMTGKFIDPTKSNPDSGRTYHFMLTNNAIRAAHIPRESISYQSKIIV